MQAVIDMATAHLQNVAVKIQELESQKQILQNEIDKLKNYLDGGSKSIEEVLLNLENQKENI